MIYAETTDTVSYDIETQEERPFDFIDEIMAQPTVIEQGVQDLAAATYMMECLVSLEQRKADNKEVLDAKVNIARAWYDEKTGLIDRQITAIKDSLLAFIQHRRETVDKKFVLSTPDGRAYPVKVPPQWKYEDEKKLVEFLEQAGRKDLLRQKLELDKKAIKEAYKVDNGMVIDSESGEVLTGITFVPEGVRLEVRK